MGNPVDSAVKDVSEILQAASGVIASTVAKAEGGLTAEELAIVLEENAGALEAAQKGLSISDLKTLFAQKPFEAIELFATFALQNAGLVAGKPLAPVEKSDLAEIVEATGSVAVSFLNRKMDGSVVTSAFLAIVQNAGKIRVATADANLIDEQFQANPAGQLLVAVQAILAYAKAIAGQLEALEYTK